MSTSISSQCYKLFLRNLKYLRISPQLKQQENAILKVREDHCDISTNPNCDLWSLSKSKATDGGALKSPPWSCPFSENIIKQICNTKQPSLSKTKTSIQISLYVKL